MKVFGVARAALFWVLSLGVWTSGPVHAADPEFTLRLHHFSSPRAMDQTRHMGPWAERVEKESNGRIKIQIFPSMQLGGQAKDLLQQVRSGIVDLIYFVPGFAPGAFPVAAALEMPFIGTGSIVMSQVAMEFFEKHLKDKPEFRGLRLVVMHATDAGLLHTRSAPVRSIEDLQGKKIRVASRQIGLLVRDLGGIPDGMPLPDVYEALARGRVDGMMIPWAITRPFRLYEVTDYHTERPMFSTMLLTLMNQRSYEKLPPDLRKIIDANSGMEYARKLGVIWEEEAQIARKKALEERGEIVQLSDEEFARWQAKAAPIHQNWVKEMNARGLAGDKMFADLNAMVRKYVEKEGARP